jgi:von Willebrand factor type A domain.
MRLVRVLLILCLATCFLPSETLSQQVTNETCEISVVVTNFLNQADRDLTPADFSVRVGGVPKAVHSASIEAGAKRIVLILDASRNIPGDQWKLETEMAQSFVGKARTKDQFALVVVGSKAAEESFMSSDEVAARLQKLVRSDGAERVYDALLTAEHLLDTPQFGDVIFLFGHDKDFGSAATFDHVRELILKNRLRLYGISFANLLARLPPGFNLNKPVPAGFGLSKLESLSRETGYAFSFFDVYAINLPGQMPRFKNYLSDLYAGIAEPYRLNFLAMPIKGKTGIEIKVADMEARKIRDENIHYPHSVFGCGVPLEKTH